MTATTPSPIRDVLTGEVVVGRYELRALVGRGGMGEVYEAVDHVLDRTVAIKVLRPELAADEQLGARFRREARTAARLSHPSIVAVHDVVVDGDRTCIVMEFATGRTLDRAVTPPVDPGRVARIGALAADALAHAHARGVVHHDVAPGNIVIGPDGSVKLLDFGIARAASGSVTAGSARGTVAYVAPEQVRGGPVDSRADVYGLGAVLFELLTGQPPLSGPGEDPITRLRRGERAPAVLSIAPETPEALAAAVDRCLEVAPGDRWPSSWALSRELRRIARKLPASSASPPVDRRSDATSRFPRGGTAMLTDDEAAQGLGRPRPASSAQHPAPARGRRSGRFLAPSSAQHPARVHGRRSGRFLAWSAVTAVLVGAALITIPAALGSGDVRLRANVRGPRPVPAPTGVQASGSCDGLFAAEAHVSWLPVDRADGYDVWRLDATGTSILAGRVDGTDTTEFRDADLGIDATYTYEVRATKGARVSKPSARAEATTPLFCFG